MISIFYFKLFSIQITLNAQNAIGNKIFKKRFYLKVLSDQLDRKYSENTFIWKCYRMFYFNFKIQINALYC